MSSTPVASAPVLKFPIKGYGAATPKTTNPPSSKSTNKTSSSAPAANDSPLTPELKSTILSTPNFRNLPQATRLHLLHGPTTNLLLDNSTTLPIPFRLLLTDSTVIKTLHSTHSSCSIPSTIKFSNLDHAAARKLTTYLAATASKWNCFYLKPSPTLLEDLKLLHAASVLGIEAYVLNIARHWLHVIKPVTWVPNSEDLGAVERYCAKGMEDRIFKATVLRVAHRVVDGDMDGSDVASLTTLAGAVERVVREMEARKVVEMEKREEWVRKKVQWEKEKKEKRRVGEERVRNREKVVEVLNAVGGVKTVTAEQAELLRRR